MPAACFMTNPKATFIYSYAVMRSKSIQKTSV
jgi:hypothetical protein